MTETNPATAPGYKAPELVLFGEEHIKQYEETGGAVGHLWNGVTTLILTTTGRRSGEERKSLMIYGRHGDSFVVIASQGGAPKHPNWYFNLDANPEVTVQVEADRFPAIARTATGDEREALWHMMSQAWPNYDTYATRTDRVIPVVVLDPVPR